MSVSSVISFMICITLFQFGSVIVLNSIAEDIKCNIGSINEQTKSTESGLELVKQFYELIQLHSTAKKLSNNSQMFESCKENDQLTKKMVNLLTLLFYID